MGYLIICDGYDYKIAKLIEEHKNHIQVTLYPDEIKRKFGIKQRIYEIDANDINEFAKQIATIEIDISLLFELIEDTTNYNSINNLASLYFGNNYSQVQMTALLFTISKQKIDFDNRQDGSFKKSSDKEREEKQLIANKAALDAAEFENYYSSLQLAYSVKANNELPGWLSELSLHDTIRLINRPDKNSIMFKAIHQFCNDVGLSCLELMHNIGKVTSLADFFVQVFMAENFAHGINYTKSGFVVDSFAHNSQVNVFSIDDSTTTEIDDAFSVQIIPNGYIVGIHIAAPALDPALLSNVANNISTIYYPGAKITMLSNEVIAKYSLDEGISINVVSIYFNLDSTFTVLGYDSKVENVTIKNNLRIESLEQLFNSENIDIDHGYLYESELKILYKFANCLEEKRGKPSVNNLFVDYNFGFDGKKIVIKPRIRGNPIDKLVSELMILANCTWGRMLTNAFIPAIYRVKQANYPVRMTLTPASHVGLNVDYYTWATSPLRRSADFINQYQIISLVTGNKNHFSSTNPELLEVVESFDNKYAKYIDFQNKMERYWSLYYLLQENISELTGTFLYKSRVQLNGIPLEIDTQGIIPHKPKGSQIKIRIFNINLAKLSFEFKILESI
jgi:exoribonuclease II